MIHALRPKRLNQQAKILPSLFLKPLKKRQEMIPVHHVQTRLTPKFWLKCLVCVSLVRFQLSYSSFHLVLPLHASEAAHMHILSTHAEDTIASERDVHLYVLYYNHSL